MTFVCFVIAAASISGVPPFNGFYSKELVYDAALERGNVFYLAAILGTFLTAASFLKLGHAAFLGKMSEQNENVREASLANACADDSYRCGMRGFRRLELSAFR